MSPRAHDAHATAAAGRDDGSRRVPRLVPVEELVAPSVELGLALGGVPARDVMPGRTWLARAAALALFAATVLGLGWIGTQVYFVIADAWIAPLHLSPDNDQVQALRLAHQRHLAELRRLDAEITRLDGELGAIDAAIGRLSALRGSTTETLKWQAERTRVEADGLARADRLLRDQRAALLQLQARQARLVERARADLAAGLTDRAVVDREEQARDQIALELTTLERQLADTTLKRQHAAVALDAFGARAGTGGAPAIGRMPELVAGDERDARIEVEIARLDAEARGHRALRAAAAASLATQRTLVAELEARPLYRAMTTATDVAFVPYDQLAAVRPGARVMDCTWDVFACEEVGRVAEVLPGEIVTQDPWGEVARGQYIVLDLDAKDAIRERVLRVRR